MEIGIDDDFDEVYEDNEENITPQDYINPPDSDEDNSTDDSEGSSDDSIILELLKTSGIKDTNKIKFESEDGVEEKSWDSLNKEEKLNILRDINSTQPDLDDEEIQLLNYIRSSRMTPSEYINYVQKSGVQNYINNQSNNSVKYSVDDLSDDELYLADLLTRMGDNITDEEAHELLEKQKENEAFFKKQIDTIRNEYKQIEDYNRQQEEEMSRQTQIEHYNRFAESVENEIRSFDSFCGYKLNMNESDMEELYEFIVGFDSAGTSIFGKALNDPKTLVKMAWFALNGEQAINDINTYWTEQIKNNRKDKKEVKNSVTIKSNNTSNYNYFDDID